MKLTVFNPNGAWVATASVLPVGKDHHIGPLALDPLRRPRARRRPPQADTSPRTWLARLRLERLRLLLPAPGEFLELTFNASIPPVICIIDDPSAETRSVIDYEGVTLSVVVASFDTPLRLSQETSWAAWVGQARVYHSTETFLGSPETSPPGQGAAITPASLFSTTFGMEAPTAAHGLLVDMDGLFLDGARRIPWRDEKPTLHGLFRFETDFGAADASRKYRLVAERSLQWGESLRRYQAAVVQATTALLDAQGLPKSDSPSVGLALAPLPSEITWYLGKSGWVFVPGSSIFDVELRGVAGAVARWSPGSISISADGMQIDCSSGAPPASGSAVIAYEYSRAGADRPGRWTGDFDVNPDPDDLLLSLQAMQLDGEATDPAVWLLTETGALQLPVDQPTPTSIDNIHTGQRMLRGVFQFAEVPWKAADKDSADAPLAPDFGAASRTRLLLMDAGQIGAVFIFAKDPDNPALKFACTSMSVKLHNPRLRLEDFVPLYIPPRDSRPPILSGPPLLPLPVAQENSLPQPNYFFGLSFVRESLQTPTDESTTWKVHLSFAPGRVDGQTALEGDWLDTSLTVQLPDSKSARALYWFRPAGLRWMPALPLYGDPRQDPEHRLCAERVLMPLRPKDGQPITLRAGDNWPISVIQKGTFYAPEVQNTPAKSPPAFTWVAPELPGVGLVLQPEASIEIEEGRPVGGLLLWVMRYELLILDELHALRALKESGKTQNQAPVVRQSGPTWWRELLSLALLTQSQRDKLTETLIHFKPGSVIEEIDLPVTIENLYARQVFGGLASLRAIPPQASVEFTVPDAGSIPLIPAGRLLEGPSARFVVDTGDPASSPVLTPSSAPDAPVEIRAGSLAPQVVDDGNRKLVFDQSGRVSFSLPDSPSRGRLTRVPADVEEQAAGSSPVDTCFQWSHPGLDLSTEDVALKLYFVGIPLERQIAAWVFDAASAGERDAVLRDFRWGAVGTSRLWGLFFQVMTLEKVEFPHAGEAEPDQPSRLTLKGVLHFIDTEIRLADQGSQEVRLTMRRDAHGWQVENLEGRFLWPLFRPTPDLADATRSNLVDPLPWLSGAVSLVVDGEGQALTLGTDRQPARFEFQFLDRTWSLPVTLLGGRLAAPLEAQDGLAWQILTAGKSPSTLAATGGQVSLNRNGKTGQVGLCNGKPIAATIGFELAVQVSLGVGQPRTLVDLALSLTISEQGSCITLGRTTLLVLSAQCAIAALEAGSDGKTRQVEINSRQISLAVNLPAGYQSNGGQQFELLPGWPLEDQAALQAYLSLSFAPQAASMDIQSVPIEDFRLLIETTLQTPRPLLALLIASLRPGQPAQVSVQLTGQFSIANQLTWRAPGGATVTHEVVFTLRQAALPGEHLTTASDRAFFAPRVIEEDASGLRGMIELPALASHRLVKHDSSGKHEIAAWVAPQQLRLGAPGSFVDEVLLRGSTRVNMSNPALPRIINGLLVLYTFDEGKGSTVHDRSGTGAALDLTIVNWNNWGDRKNAWSANGLYLRSRSMLASEGAASKIVDACKTTNEISIEVWVKTASLDQKDSACLVTLSKNSGQDNITLGLEWEQKWSSGKEHSGKGSAGKTPAGYYYVTWRTANADTGKSRNQPDQKTHKLETSPGTLTTALAHVVFTRDSSGVARIYIDGVEKAKETLKGWFSRWDNKYRLTIADQEEGSRSFLGEFRLAAVYERALTPAEVRQNFQAGYPPKSKLVYENGFAGPLGDALAEALRESANETMIVEATQAFWLRPMSVADAAARDFSVLWREGSSALTGLPSMESDFFPLDAQTTHNWSRLPLPFLTDTAGLIGAAAQPSTTLGAALQCALPEGKTAPKVDGVLIVSREALLQRSMLDRYSLRNRPLHPGFGRPMDQVLLQPEAHEYILPYTQTLQGFAPGWLVFTDWPPNAAEDKDTVRPKPFSAAGEAISRWVGAPSAALILAAATEMVPEALPPALPWQQLIGPDGRPRPYLLASPLIAIRQTAAVSSGSGGAWVALESVRDIRNFPPDAIHLALHWVNHLSVDELTLLVKDAPGGYSDAGEGYGIGRDLAARVVEARDQAAPTGFKTIEELLAVEGFGIDKLSDLMLTAIQACGSDIRILVEIWVPAPAGQGANGGGEPVLAARSVFRLAVNENDDWDAVLFSGPADGRPESPVRAKVREWVRQESSAVHGAFSPLLRAKTLTPVETLPPTFYSILARAAEAGGQRPLRRGVFGSPLPLRPDLRFEALREAPLPDPLALGPDYLGGRVYYEQDAWFEPEPPVVDDPGPAGVIGAFTVEPALVDAGQPVTFTWQATNNPELELGVKNGLAVINVTGKQSHTLIPERTAVYTLTASPKDGGSVSREVGVLVCMPAAGSAVGLVHKLAGVAPGPAHASRLSRAEQDAQEQENPPKQQEHRWVETFRDLMYLDLTRDKTTSPGEPGWFLPPSRKLAVDLWPERNTLRPFLPTRAVQFFTSGRPGSLMRARTALLNEGRDGMLRRSASMAYEFRHPRPVPLPRELYPFDPDQDWQPGDPQPRRTCGLELLEGSAPFHFTRLKWQDPIFNRRLLASGQEASGKILVLGLDRAMYAGVDVIYPEIRFTEALPAGCWIDLTVSLHRKDERGAYTLGKLVYRVIGDAVYKLPDLEPAGALRGTRQTDAPKGIRRWVWELGLEQPAVLEDRDVDNDNFDLALQNYDEVRVMAQVMDKTGSKELERLQLTGMVRTDVEVWPQPQSAFGILRADCNREAAATDLSAFGWLPKPRVIKRGNRFDPNSWQGTFTYVDTWTGAPARFRFASEIEKDSQLPGQMDYPPGAPGSVPDGLRAIFAQENIALDAHAQVSLTPAKRDWWVTEQGDRVRKFRVVKQGNQMRVSCLFEATYEVLAVTSYGEQPAPEIDEDENEEAA